MKFEFSQADNTYYMVKHYPEIQKSLSATSSEEDKALGSVKVYPEPVVEDEEDPDASAMM